MSNDAVIPCITTQNTSILIFTEITENNIHTLVAINKKNNTLVAKAIKKSYNPSISDKDKKIADEDFRNFLSKEYKNLVDFQYPYYNNCSLIIENTGNYYLYPCDGTVKKTIETITKGGKIGLKAAQDFSNMH